MRSRLADAGPSLGVCAVSAGLIAHACNAEPDKPKGAKAERSWVHTLLGPEEPSAVATSKQPQQAKKLGLRRGMRLPSETRDALVQLARSAPPAPLPELAPPPPPPPKPEPPRPVVVARKPAPPPPPPPAPPPPEPKAKPAPEPKTVAASYSVPTEPAPRRPPQLLEEPLPVAIERPGEEPVVAKAPAPEPRVDRASAPAPVAAYAPAPAPIPAAVAPAPEPVAAPAPAPAPVPAPAPEPPPAAPEPEPEPAVVAPPPPPPAPTAVAPAPTPRVARAPKPLKPKRIDRPRRPTPMSPNDATRYLAQAWEHLTGERATEEVISVLWGQWALETGRGRWMVDYNYAGLKGRAPDGGTANWWTWEEADDGARRIRARFRSYEAPEHGALDYIEMLVRRYPKALAAARRGDAVNFIFELDHGGFFTERPEHYVRSVASLAREFRRDSYAVLFSE